MALRRSPGLSYTAQDVASFCEVDLKTVHHWADRGRVPHTRTEGRHLRFRRNELVAFLRAHGYPLPPEITAVRPRVLCAARAPGLSEALAPRFDVTRFDHAVLAIARIAKDEPDALVVSLDDPSLGGRAALDALGSARETAWIALVALEAEADAREAARELAEHLGVSAPPCTP